MSLKEKAKTANEVMWETERTLSIHCDFNCAECNIEICNFRTKKQWVKLEDAEKEIERIRMGYEVLISKAEKDCVDCYQKTEELIASKQKRIDELKQQLQQLIDELGHRERWDKEKLEVYGELKKKRKRKSEK